MHELTNFLHGQLQIRTATYAQDIRHKWTRGTIEFIKVHDNTVTVTIQNVFQYVNKTSQSPNQQKWKFLNKHIHLKLKLDKLWSLTPNQREISITYNASEFRFFHQYSQNHLTNDGTLIENYQHPKYRSIDAQ